MNVYRTPAEEFSSRAVALIWTQQPRQWHFGIENSRERRRWISHCSASRCRFGIASIAIAALAMLLSSSRSFGQSTFGSIRGTVQDASGAVIPGAQVALHNIDENTDRTVTSDDAGNYVLENVQAGKYRLRVSHKLTNGFVWARFVALLVEVVGAETGDASTFYSALNAAGTIPFVFMIWLDGFGYSKFGTRGLLWTDAAPNLLVFAIVATVLVIRGMNLQSRPAQQLPNL